MAPARTNSTASGPISAFSFLSFDAQSSVDEDEARNDLEGLVQLLTELRDQGIRLCEVTYVVNRWALGGIIPMTHHGFIFQTTRRDFFTLDFGRKGIVWDVMDEYPEHPDNTFYVKRYKIDMDTSAVQRYCEETPPFNFPFYDCETWAKGMLSMLAVEKGPENRGRISKEVCAPSLNQASMGSAGYPNGPPGAGRKQRTGACI